MKKLIKDITGISSLQATVAQLNNDVAQLRDATTQLDRNTFLLGKTLDGHTFLRGDRFAPDETHRISLQEITKPALREKIDRNPFEKLGRQELIADAVSRPRWRYHHGVEEIRNDPSFYGSYAKRVETMLRMIDTVLESENLIGRLPHLSAADLACSEGFVAMRYLQKGLREIDCYELNIDQIERLQIIQTLKKVEGINLYRLDLENVAWASAIGKAYDLVFCLGIVYHSENPMLFLRNLYSITNNICIIESDTPKNPLGFGCLSLQDCQVTLRKGEVRYFLEQRPNRRALVDMLLNAGFSSVDIIECPPDEESRDLRGAHKTIAVAKK
jgi:2-polyprenyl-3-methyl-5-hydroxy-6-metoxy-1,4-benzoquinol methylase